MEISKFSLQFDPIKGRVMVASVIGYDKDENAVGFTSGVIRMDTPPKRDIVPAIMMFGPRDIELIGSEPVKNCPNWWEGRGLQEKYQDILQENRRLRSVD